MKKFLLSIFILLTSYRICLASDVSLISPEEGEHVDTVCRNSDKAVTFYWEDDSDIEYTYSLNVYEDRHRIYTVYTKDRFAKYPFINDGTYTWNVGRYDSSAGSLGRLNMEYTSKRTIYVTCVSDNYIPETEEREILGEENTEEASNTETSSETTVEDDKIDEKDGQENKEVDGVNTKEKTSIKKSVSKNSSYLLGFPFKKIIGVTQWYGNTVFQQPHTGIDFGATKEVIISPGDGTVVARGWDNYFGECLSGGYYLVIKHTNGMYTAYMHIESFLVSLNEKVNKGEAIAISGNTGSWNCQPLKYHLHFETRKSRSQSTHVNPVEYIDIDWDTVPTLGYEYVPGRLSGENPHPNF